MLILTILLLSAIGFFAIINDAYNTEKKKQAKAEAERQAYNANRLEYYRSLRN